MRDTGIVRRLWRDAAFSGGAWLVVFVFSPVTTVCLSWRLESRWEYLATSALYSPSLLISLILFSLMVGFSLTAFLCSILIRRDGLRPLESEPGVEISAAR